MLTKDVPEFLNISRSSLYNYRKRLGIVEETKDKITEKHLEQIKRLRNSRNKPANVTETEQIAKVEAKKENNQTGFLEVSQDDSIQLVNLKDQYNSNQQLINHLDKTIKLDIQKFITPEKAVTDTMEKYQKLNIALLKQIESVKPQEEDLGKIIKDKLANRIQWFHLLRKMLWKNMRSEEFLAVQFFQMVKLWTLHRLTMLLIIFE